MQVNNESVKAIGRRYAFVALDQKDEFGSVQATIDAYRENLMDTMQDEGIAPWTWVAVLEYDRLVNKGE